MNKDVAARVNEYRNALYSLTILRDINEEEPMKAFYSLLKALLTDSFSEALKSYYKMTATLITANSHKISGNIFVDFLIEWVSFKEHEFAKKALSGTIDIVCERAFRHDLLLLFTISGFNTSEAEALMSATAEMREGDRIQAISNAVWGGGLSKGSSNQKVQLISWNYPDNSIEHNIFGINFADAALYFCNCDIDNTEAAFRALYEDDGTGLFQKYRLLRADSERGLYGISSLTNGNDNLPQLYEDESRKIEGIFQEIADSGERKNIMLEGSVGTGKTTMICKMADLFLDLTFIYISMYSMPDMYELFDKIGKQPFGILMIIDDIHNADDISRYIGTYNQPDNLSIVCISECNASTDLFDTVITLGTLDAGAIAKYICDISVSPLDPEYVKNICMDYQIENKKVLTFRSIKEILKQINA